MANLNVRCKTMMKPFGCNPNMPKHTPTGARRISGRASPNEPSRTTTRQFGLRPEYPEAYVSRGVIRFNLGQFELAVQDYDDAILIDPRFGDAYAERAVAYTSLNRDLAAAEDVELAVELGVDRRVLEARLAGLKEQR